MFINKTRMFAGWIVTVAGLTPALAETSGFDRPALEQSPVAQLGFAGKGDGEETCPVTGQKLADRRLKTRLFGRDVYFCCEGCVRQALANPARYIKASLAEQRAALSGPTALGRQAHTSPAEPAICE
jgi:YHS domain-containing protein